MERVTGIGGFFFRARDPKALGKWYFERLGISNDYKEAWNQESGETAFTPFPSDSTMFGKPEQMWMINFRVSNLDAMVAQLREGGEDVTVDPEAYDFGRFATLNDPEGNPIQLWEPK